ncbi:hypothetical protein [Dyadobacter sandarakinus]|uniref:Uncharacterized protein n=1 Tax=Dyadobacter sandarakinus TaxID=2747268 RepID=A0ABX7I3S7_9BACT|nr:hypothetical protein [Dyadobacter sandarakinus]QRR00217.1 hypothetical protein HWI92_04510 [Dyadobacter sandarakinus]
MTADIIIDEQSVQLSGRVAFTATDQEPTVNGPIAGLAFHDRSNPEKRYVLYGDQGKIRLWQDGAGDLALIAAPGTLSAKTADTETVVTNKIIINSHPGGQNGILFRWEDKVPVLIGKGAQPRIVEREMDLVKTIDELEDKLAKLTERLRAVESKVGIVSPIVIGH